MKDLSRHPCFNKESAGSCGRVHLPVAPKCNIQCNYCNRKYDCVNESRPGVTSGVLTPPQALAYMEKVLEAEPRITVAGIAGPGDPFANARDTLETMRLLKEHYPDLIFCLSSNGLGIAPHLDELATLDVSHVTVTLNAVDPDVGAKIYSWVRDGKVVYRGREAAELLLSRQLEAIKGLKERDILVKINTIVIPGVNDHHIQAITDVVSAMGVDIMNLIPMKPTADTPFAAIPEPGKEMITSLRAVAGEKIKQMTHCRRCRADAVGLLGDDKSASLCGTLQACAALKPLADYRPYVAVATQEGMLVNRHLGEAESFQIWAMRNGVPELVEERLAPKPGCGPKRWEELARTLKDCRAVLASAMGEQPRKILSDHGVDAHTVSGFIEPALNAVYGNGDINLLKGRTRGVGCCASSGGGCA